MLEDLMGLVSGGSGGVGLLIIFVILTLCGLGLPLPEDILLFAAGYLVYLEMVKFRAAVVVCLAGVLLGDLILFSIGRRLGLKVFEMRWFRRLINRARLKKARHYFSRYGLSIVFFGRFLPGLRAPIFLTAAILRMPVLKFLAIDGVAALVSVPLFIYLANYFGEDIDLLAKIFKEADATLLSIWVGLVFFFIWYWRRYHRATDELDR